MHACTETEIVLKDFTTIPPPFVPGPVTNLIISLRSHDDRNPSIALSWCQPENCTSARDIKEYHIDIFANLSDGNISSIGDHKYSLKTFTIPGNVMQLTVNREDGLIPLISYTVQVRAESQEGKRYVLLQTTNIVFTLSAQRRNLPYVLPGLLVRPLPNTMPR